VGSWRLAVGGWWLAFGIWQLREKNGEEKKCLIEE